MADTVPVLRSVVLDTTDARALAEFYRQLLGARVLEDRSEDPDEPLYVYADPAGHPFCIFVGSPPGGGMPDVSG